jgi:pimeloyl-ACP methyl ester carboxylesterase
MRPSEEGYVSSYDGTRIHYRSEGDGIPLIACNGVLCSYGYWVYFRRFFRSRCRTVVWDYRGHGRSELPTHGSRIGIPSYCDDLKSVLDGLEIPKAVLVGHSMGVQVILEFYRRHPERVAALVPVSGTYAHASRTFFGIEWLEKVLPPLLQAGERHAGAVARVLKPLLRTPLPDPLARLSGSVNWYLCPREIMEDYFRHIESLDFRFAARALLAMEGHSAEDVLGTIDVPTLVIAGEKDRMTPLWVMEKMWRSIPGADLLVIPKGTHTALVENPLLMNLRIELFLRDHGLQRCDPSFQAPGARVESLSGRKGKKRIPPRAGRAAKRRAAGGSSGRRARAGQREGDAEKRG